MTPDEVFEAWAPRGSAWTDWAKPVLFAQMPAQWATETSGVAAAAEGLALEAIAADGKTAVILDLPGDAGVGTALNLARRGFQPVPVFNGAANGEYAPLAGNSMEVMATIDVWSVMRALWIGAEELRRMTMALNAPPVFMLDSRRRLGERSPLPGVFDNRWIVFPTDFPSGRVMRERGIERAVVVCWRRSMPDADVSHTLAGWQGAGISILVLQVEVDTAPREVVVRKPGVLSTWWYALTAAVGLRRRALGGFGGAVPSASGGGG